MKVEGLLFEAIRFMQLILVPTFGFLSIVGFFFFLISIKSPHRRRKAYLTSIFAPIGFLVFLYGPVIHAYYIFDNPAESQGDETAKDIVNQVEGWGGKIYNGFEIIVEPIIFFLFYLGVTFMLMAAKNPARKRLGMGLIVGTPLLWLLVQYGPKIYRLFV